jgi:hypothetical protein
MERMPVEPAAMEPAPMATAPVPSGADITGDGDEKKQSAGDER